MRVGSQLEIIQLKRAMWICWGYKQIYILLKSGRWKALVKLSNIFLFKQRKPKFAHTNNNALKIKPFRE